MFKKIVTSLGLSCMLIVLLAACGPTNGPNPVHMNGNNFVQSSITIKKGESITLMDDNLFSGHTIANGTWQNGTAKPAREEGVPEVKNLQIGGNSSGTIGPFTTAGIFQFYCTVHPGMNLTVIVQ